MNIKDKLKFIINPAGEKWIVGVNAADEKVLSGKVYNRGGDLYLEAWEIDCTGENVDHGIGVRVSDTLNFDEEGAKTAIAGQIEEKQLAHIFS